MQNLYFRFHRRLALLLKPLGLCPVHFWWGLLFLLACLFSGKALGQQLEQEVLLEYRQVSGFWNGVTKVKNYWYPEPETQQAYYPALGFIWQKDTLLGEALKGANWIRNTPPANVTPINIRILVDTAANWHLMRPQEWDPKQYRRVSVRPVFLINEGNHTAFIPLTDSNQFPLQTYLLTEEGQPGAITRSPMKFDGGGGWLRIPPGGQVFTVIHPILGDPDGLAAAYQVLALMHPDGHPIRFSEPFLDYH